MPGESSNDAIFDPRAQLAALSPADAVAYVHHIIDEHCEAKDAAYMKAVIVAGARSAEVSLEHAMAGSPVAQTTYGAARLNGLHVDQDVAEGLFWLRRAHNNGHAHASILLCIVYLDGKQVARNTEKALSYVEAAADRGLASAQFVLANMLLDGESAPVDEARAVALLRASARGGYAKAAELLAENGLSID